MKYVSRVLFGFSTVAVLALFTACPQAADTKKSIPAELNVTEEKIAEALMADITSGLDFQKNPVEVTGDLSISKKLTIGTETDVAVAVAVAKKAGGEVTGLNIDTTTSADKITVTVPNASGNADDEWNVTFTFTKESKTKTFTLPVVNKKAAGGAPSTELNVTEEKIAEALMADITSGLDFQKNPVEVTGDLSISKKLTIGTETDVAVAVAVAKKAGGEVAGLNIDTTTSADKITVTVPNASGNADDEWNVTFTFTKESKTKTFTLPVVNKKA